MSSRKISVLTIHTPEGLSFSLPLAGVATRFMAYLIDLGLLVAGTVGLVIGLSIIGFVAPDLMVMILLLCLFVLWTGYGIALEWYWRGQTIGKRTMGLRVMDEGGLNLRFSQIVVRNLLRCVDMPFVPLPLPIPIPFPFCLPGGVASVLTRRCQRLGDLAARTIVVRIPKLSEPDLQNLMADKYNSFREYPHLEARLRQRVTPAQAGVALQALLRRESLDATSRVELFAEIAACFRAIVEFPQNATEGLSDEHYVRNVVETLYRKRS